MPPRDAEAFVSPYTRGPGGREEMEPGGMADVLEQSTSDAPLPVAESGGWRRPTREIHFNKIPVHTSRAYVKYSSVTPFKSSQLLCEPHVASGGSGQR